MKKDEVVEEVYTMVKDILNDNQVNLLAMKIMSDKLNSKKDSKVTKIEGVEIVKQVVYGVPLDLAYQTMMTIVGSLTQTKEISE